MNRSVIEKHKKLFTIALHLYNKINPSNKFKVSKNNLISYDIALLKNTNFF